MAYNRAVKRLVRQTWSGSIKDVMDVVVNARSPELDDHEIIVIQTAFAILTQNQETHHGSAHGYVKNYWQRT